MYNTMIWHDMLYIALHWAGDYIIRSCILLFSAAFGTTWTIGLGGLIISSHGVQGWMEMVCRGWLGRILVIAYI